MFAKAVLVAAAAPFLLVAAVAAALGGARARRTPAEAAALLRDFLEGRGGAWDWDDFTSVPIADPQLEAIRHRAAAVDLPATEDGLAVLRGLLGEAERLAQERERGQSQ